MIICSVKHTGTQFYLWFLSRHPNVKDRPADLTYDGQPGMGCYANGNVVSYHIGEHPGDQDNSLKDLAEAARAIVPVRDPMLSILTYRQRKRNPMLLLLEGNRATYMGVTDGYKLFSTMDTDRVLFTPIDLPWSTEERIARLKEVEAHCKIEHDETWTVKYAQDWAVRNTAGDSGLKEAYCGQKDVAAVYQAFPRDVQYLLNNKDTIIPFLEARGYNNLPWFNWRPSM